MHPKFGIVWRMPSPTYATSTAMVLFLRLDCSIGPTRHHQKNRVNCPASRCIVLVGIELLTKAGWRYGP